jgi:GTP cyclohydrolase I
MSKKLNAAEVVGSMDMESNEKNERIEKLVYQLLVELGEDPDREGLIKTPHRVAKSLQFLTRGYNQDPEALINEAIFSEDDNEMVVLTNIDFYSMCEHHMLPFHGKAHVGYVPNGKIIGVSKLARIVDLFARRLQVQERLTRQVANFLMETLEPHGVAVVMEGSHMCMKMRGVEKQNSLMVTSSMLGEFRENLATREEFLQLLRSSKL